MNYERIHFIYYLYNSVVVLFLLLGLGKFFCVRRLYDLYDEINSDMQNTLAGWIFLATAFSIISYLCLYWTWKFGIVISAMAMTLASFCLIIVGAVYIIRYVASWLYQYHLKIKYKKL